MEMTFNAFQSLSDLKIFLPFVFTDSLKRDRKRRRKELILILTIDYPKIISCLQHTLISIENLKWM